HTPAILILPKNSVLTHLILIPRRVRQTPAILILPKNSVLTHLILIPRRVRQTPAILILPKNSVLTHRTKGSSLLKAPLPFWERGLG
ncbi:hypothetical protein, partial [Arthrospira sp. PCC 8006]|uniref:hypothetical protein n=1 Tax=Arthrospira sp. PCC 8006 TaxID=1982224 RepID=UPI00396F5997